MWARKWKVDYLQKCENILKLKLFFLEGGHSFFYIAFSFWSCDMNSTCTAVYISPNKCSYTWGKCLFRSFSAWGTDLNISGYNDQNSVEMWLVLESRCGGFSVLKSRCHGTLRFCKILTLIPPDITPSSRFSTTVVCFLFFIY